MKLCYRGVQYNYAPPELEVSEREALGRYRGRSLRFSYVRHVPFPQPEASMTFRGASYRTDSHGRIESAEPHKPATRRSKFAPVFDSMAAARRRLLQESASVHRENIRRSLERRLEVAQLRGDEALVRQLEDEMHQIA